MKNEQAKRKNILISPDYRTLIGLKLRKKRITLNYSVGDIAFMMDIPERTVISMEGGEVTNIDYYVEYAKAVRYPMETLRSLNIPLEPLRPLPQERKDKIRLTHLIRERIVKGGFLKERRSVEDIRNELIALKLIPKDNSYSKKIAGIMRNLVDDQSVTVVEKSGRKNLYTTQLTIIRNEEQQLHAMAGEKPQSYTTESKKFPIKNTGAKPKK